MPSESFYKFNSSQSTEFLALYTLRLTPNEKRFSFPHIWIFCPRVITESCSRVTHGVTFRLDQCLNIKEVTIIIGYRKVMLDDGCV